MTVFWGVVEDINDPLKLDRVRVRIFGLHTDNKSLIPTESLPWAIVEKGTDSASMSGIGTSGHGLLPGSWVTLEFFDEEKQYPLVRGSIPGIPFDIKQQAPTDDELEFSDSESVPANVVRDSQGAPVTDSQGNPITTGDKSTEATPPGKVDISKLGSVSAQFESNGNPNTVNNYKTGQDSGGASYGCYQFASYLLSPQQPARNRTLAQAKNAPVIQYLSTSPFGAKFAGLTPATPDFDSCWRSITNKEEFRADQHSYIAQKYYQVAAAKLPSSITSRGQAVHEAIWSRAVQLGPGNAAQQIAAAASNTTADVCDSKIVELIYDYQIANIPTNFASSQGLWSSLRSRFESEKSKLITMAKSYEKNCSGEYTTVEQKKIEHTEDGKTATTVQVVTPVKKPNSKGQRGFQDPDGKYPTRYNEPDTSRVARGVITGTPIEKKRTNVVSKQSAGATTISEPVTQYNAKYPHNRVYESESGHLIEYDDSPGYERIHIYHKSGAFIEIHPDGKIVHKTPNSNHTIVANNNDLIVLGKNNRHIEEDENGTIQGNLNIKVFGDANLEVNGSYNITAGAVNIDSTVNVTGDVIAGGISTISHGHSKVRKGPDVSGPPVGAGGAGRIRFPGADDGVDNLAPPTNDNGIIIYDNSPEGLTALFQSETAISSALPGHAEDATPPVKSDDPDPATPPPTGCDGTFNEPVTQQDMMKKCSNNFTLGHCKMMPTAQLGLMSSQIACNWKKLCENILEPTYAQFQFSVNSGFRSEAYNKSLEDRGYHPSKTSDHMTGCAADISMPTQEQTVALFKWIKNSGLPFSQLIFETTWVHVAFGGRPHNDAYKIAYSENKGASIAPGGIKGDQLPTYLA
jgi:hypothetical protein